ncbi:MAG TPA: hypothetical protein VLA37_05185, partial [Sphingomonadaceae bacterium]|nr:hypothetical protein [Sphingomonadaceae bacterium]
MSTGTYLNFVLSLIFVIGLIGVVAWAYKRFALGGRLGIRPGGGRLDVVETRAIDAKRRLVLVRRDRVEHLILVGA